ncbi:ABC transporter ATP-binding protein [bacterium]|nr:ABC transporter ATP-binding protein [bacterium]
MIQTNQLTKGYGQTAVLNGVDLIVPKGAVVGLMGKNGSGKTTLIKCLLGLLRIEHGTASILGCDPWNLSAAAKERIGYVPQVVNLYDWMKVENVIRYTASFYSAWDYAWSDELAKRWHVPLDKRVQTISPGQLQSLALILAIGHRPELLILDEPLASLDPIARRDVLRSLLNLSDDGSRSILFSTHISVDIERIATHVAILQGGKLAHFAELDDLKEHVKRLRVRMSQDIPKSFNVPGALRTQIEGGTALVAIPNVTDGLLENLRDRWHADIDVEDLNLDEIFLELNGDA